MTLRWIIATLHLFALPIGLGAIWVRSRALKRPLVEGELKRIFLADSLWGVAAVLWLGTGVWRAFLGLEKGTAYYVGTPVFHAKMGLFLLVVLLELWPAITLMKWRAQARRGQPIDTAPARMLARISHAEAGIVIIIVFLATALARGLRP